MKCLQQFNLTFKNSNLKKRREEHWTVILTLPPSSQLSLPLPSYVLTFLHSYQVLGEGGGEQDGARVSEALIVKVQHSHLETFISLFLTHTCTDTCDPPAQPPTVRCFISSIIPNSQHFQRLPAPSGAVNTYNRDSFTWTNTRATAWWAMLSCILINNCYF